MNRNEPSGCAAPGIGILDYFALDRQDLWLEEIGKSDWGAGQYLYRLLKDGQFHSLLGKRSRLLLLTESDRLAGFCTYAERDEIPGDDLTPWAGFVYIFPQFRGRRRMGKLLEHVYRLAKTDGFPCVYISTDHTGLYEKYGCTFFRTMRNTHGQESRIYRLQIVNMDYSGILGTQVSGTVDLPAGSTHPGRPDLYCPVNCGYVDGIMAADGEEQNVYILGTDRPLRTFTGTVTGVWHRLNDCGDQWIVSPDGRRYPEKDILQAIWFQEQYFMGELYT